MVRRIDQGAGTPVELVAEAPLGGREEKPLVREASRRIDAELEKRGYCRRSVVAFAYLDGRIEIDAIEHRIAFYEARRMAAIKEIERRNEDAAEQLKRATARVIEHDFKQAIE